MQLLSDHPFSLVTFLVEPTRIEGIIVAEQRGADFKPQGNRSYILFEASRGSTPGKLDSRFQL